MIFLSKDFWVDLVSYKVWFSELCFSRKFPHLQIRWNYGILRSACHLHFGYKMWVGAHFTLWKISTFRKFSLPVVYIFKMAWICFAKFWLSDQRFIWNIFAVLRLKFETSTHAQPFKVYFSQIFGSNINRKLTLRMMPWIMSYHFYR